MRRHMVLAGVTLAFSIVILSILATAQVRANMIEAKVNIDPGSLLMKEDGHGKWITVYIELPDGYDVKDIDVSSVTLEVMGAHVSRSRYDIQGDILMVKFDRGLVTSLLWSMIEHMSPHAKQEVTMEVTGTLDDGSPFAGSDTVKVFFTHV